MDPNEKIFLHCIFLVAFSIPYGFRGNIQLHWLLLAGYSLALVVCLAIYTCYRFFNYEDYNADLCCNSICLSSNVLTS